MNARTLVTLSSAIEAATGIALIAVPDVVARILLGAELSISGVVVARVAGFGLLSLAIACWPHGDDASISSVRGLFVYNLLAAIYFAYVGVSGIFFTYLLWAVCALHGLLAILMVRPVYKTFGTAR